MVPTFSFLFSLQKVDSAVMCFKLKVRSDHLNRKLSSRGMSMVTNKSGWGEKKSVKQNKNIFMTLWIHESGCRMVCYTVCMTEVWGSERVNSWSIHCVCRGSCWGVASGPADSPRPGPLQQQSPSTAAAPEMASSWCTPAPSSSPITPNSLKSSNPSPCSHQLSCRLYCSHSPMMSGTHLSVEHITQIRHSAVNTNMDTREMVRDTSKISWCYMMEGTPWEGAQSTVRLGDGYWSLNPSRGAPFQHYMIPVTHTAFMRKTWSSYSNV